MATSSWAQICIQTVGSSLLKSSKSVLDCPGAIVSKFSGLAARPELVTSPQQNWQQLSKLQELIAAGGAGGGARPSTGLLRLCTDRGSVAVTLCQ